MKKIVLNDIEYTVPTKWSDVSLNDLIVIDKLKDTLSGSSLTRIAIMSVYTQIPEEQLKRAKIADLKEVFNALAFIGTEIKTIPVDSFKFKGCTYYVSQNLLSQEFQEYISLQNIIQQFKGKEVQAIPMILGVMSKKSVNGVLESLDDYDLIERSEAFKELDVVTAQSIAVFFSQSINALSSISLLYSNPSQMIAEKLLEVESTLKPQGGQGLRMKCVNGILLIYLKYIKRKLNKHSIS